MFQKLSDNKFSTLFDNTDRAGVWEFSKSKPCWLQLLFVNKTNVYSQGRNTRVSFLTAFLSAVNQFVVAEMLRRVKVRL